MYYEEKQIDGVWYWRGAPDDDWTPFNATKLYQKLAQKDARIAELERALRAAHQYMMPSVNRGPAYASWCMAIEMVEPLIGESEGRSLIAQCGL